MEYLDHPAEQVVGRPPAKAVIKSTQPPAYPFKEVADCLGLVQHPVAGCQCPNTP